jgi:hypothetical protein
MVWLLKCVLTAMAGLLLFLQLGHGARKQHRRQLCIEQKKFENAWIQFFEQTNLMPLAVAIFSILHNIFSNIFPKTNMAQFPSYVHTLLIIEVFFVI